MRRVRIFAGTALTAAGVAWLVERLDSAGAAAAALARALPALLLVAGASQLLGLLWRSRLLGPTVLLLAGGGGLVALHASPSDLAGPRPFWPIVAVLAGLALALAERGHRTSDEGNIDQVAVLRTRTVRRGERPFKIAKIRVVLGSLELDLSRCRSLPRNAQVNLTVWLGHVRIVVPDHYQVTVQSDALAVEVPSLPVGDGSVPIVKVTVLGFGGGVDVRRAWTQPVLASTSAGPAPATQVSA